ncbi:MAG: DUF3828 domain-containing protein [Owenweeksia sp.]
MTKTLLTSLSGIILLVLNPLSIHGQDFSDEKAIAMLHNFYHNYLAEQDNPGPESNIDAVLEKYLSKPFIQELNTLALDYDPFINAQDFDPDLADKLSIEKVKDSQRTFLVSYPGWEEIVQIRLTVLLENGEYRVASLPDME